jgi:hypothetical protein
MNKTDWQPTNKPGRYDSMRVATLEPIHRAIARLQLPPIRSRKLMAICNALEMQIADGGDAPEVNRHLLEALKLAVVHQVGQKGATAVIQAIEDFARKEELRWEQIWAGTLPPPELEQDEKLDELIQTGYELMSMDQTAAGCDQWLLAWEQVKEMVTPDMRTVEAFDEAYPDLYNLSLIGVRTWKWNYTTPACRIRFTLSTGYAMYVNIWLNFPMTMLIVILLSGGQKAKHYGCWVGKPSRKRFTGRW